MAIRIIRALSILGVTSSLVFSGIWLVLAVQGVNILVGQSSGTNFSFSANGTLLQIQPGNITFLELAGSGGSGGSGIHWTGFYGNISGNLSLEDANGNVFYDWVGLGIAKGEVFASNTSVVDWPSINCTSATQIDAINAYLNISQSDKDSVNATYYLNLHPAFDVAAVSIPANTCNSTNAFTNGVANSSLFNQILLADTNNIPVFTTLINASSPGYDGDPVDFELLAGIPSGVSMPSLYFFMELG